MPVRRTGALPSQPPPPAWRWRATRRRRSGVAHPTPAHRVRLWRMRRSSRYPAQPAFRLRFRRRRRAAAARLSGAVSSVLGGNLAMSTFHPAQTTAQVAHSARFKSGTAFNLVDLPDAPGGNNVIISHSPIRFFAQICSSGDCSGGPQPRADLPHNAFVGLRGMDGICRI